MIDPATRVEDANEARHEHYAESEEEHRMRLDYERKRSAAARRRQGRTPESCPTCGALWGSHKLTCRRGGGIYDAGDRHLDT